MIVLQNISCVYNHTIQVIASLPTKEGTMDRCCSMVSTWTRVGWKAGWIVLHDSSSIGPDVLP